MNGIPPPIPEEDEAAGAIYEACVEMEQYGGFDTLRRMIEPSYIATQAYICRTLPTPENMPHIARAQGFLAGLAFVFGLEPLDGNTQVPDIVRDTRARIARAREKKEKARR